MNRAVYLPLLLLLLIACESASTRAGTEPQAPRFDAPSEPRTPRGSAPSFDEPERPAPTTALQLLEARRPMAHLSVQETANLFRSDEHVSIGVPFTRGSLDDADRLRAWWARDGSALPIQTRVLSRWPDDSLRWVLVDTRVEVAARDDALLVLGLADDIAATPTPWQLSGSPDSTLTLSDGNTSWAVLAKREDGDTIADMRALLVDRFGHEYVARLDTDVSWLEWGPLRATALITGRHRRLDDAGLEIDFHDLRVWIHFLAGRSAARVEWSIENGPLENPPGRLAFQSYELQLPLPGLRPSARLEGRRVNPGQSFSVAQTTAGTERTVGGVRVAPGPPSDLWVGLSNDEVEETEDLWVQRVESAENHPSGLSFTPGGPLRIELLSAAGGEEFWLDDASRKTFRLNLARDLGTGGRTRVATARNPVHVALDPFELRLTRAWGDNGLFVVPSPGEKRVVDGPPSDSPTGWADWGERLTKNTHSTGSPRNRLSVFLEAVQTGRVDLYRWNRSRAWHAMDLRPYHLRGFDADVYPLANLHEGTPHYNEQPHNRLGRTEMKQRFLEYKEGLPEKGHGYNGFDPEHMALDDVYEYYLLSGSWPALDALRSAGEAMLTWWEVREDGKSYSSRTFGWTLRALIQVHRATGEDRYLDAARRMVQRQDELRGKGDVKWFIKQKPDGRHIADKEWDAPFMVAVAMHGLVAYHFETNDPIVPAMLADLSSFCVSAHRPAAGVFMPDIPVDGSPIPEKSETPLGTSLWIPGALAAAASITGEYDDVDAVLTTYAMLYEHPDRPLAIGRSGWPWWQPYMVAMRRRFGSAAPAKIEKDIQRRIEEKRAQDAGARR